MYHNKDHYMNAFQELVDALATWEKTINDIEWVANEEGLIEKNWFLIACEGTFYLNPSPYGNIDLHLVITGRDFWLSRELASSHKDKDYWMIHHMPAEPPIRVSVFTLFKTYPKMRELSTISRGLISSSEEKT